LSSLMLSGEFCDQKQIRREVSFLMISDTGTVVPCRLRTWIDDQEICAVVV
jgi:hypothetical protein